MKYEITKQTKTSATLTITATKAYMAVYHQAILKRLKKDLKVDGFRPGQAPDKIAERQLGEQRVQAEVLEEIVMQAYAGAIRESKLTTVAAPKIEVKKFVPYSELEFTATVAIMTKIDFELNKLSVKYAAPKVADKDIEEAIETLRQQMAERTPITTGAKKGDELIIDFDGVRDGKPVEGAAGENSAIVIGEGRFIPGFEENLEGLKKGDKKTFEVTFPKDYHAKELAGEKVEFSVTVKEVKEVILPKVDDAFATHVGPFKSVAELRENASNSIAAQKTSEYEKEYEDKVIAQLLEKAQFEVADELVDDVQHRLEHETEDQLKNSGLDLEKYLKIQSRTREDYEKELRTEAERRVKLGIAMRYIIEQEKLAVTEDEIDHELEHMRSHYTDPKMQAELNSPKFRDDLRTHVLTGKAIKKLVTYAKK